MGYVLGRVAKTHRIEELIQKGRIRFNKLATFRGIEGKVRGDPNEGLLMHFSGLNPDLKVTAVFPDGTEMPIEGTIRMAVDSPDRHLGVFCMTMLPTLDGGKFDTKELITIGKHIHMRTFGDSLAIFKDTPEFVRRLVAAATKAGFELLHDPVDYHPPDYCGDVTPWDKIGDYAYQKEYRFVTTEPVPGEHLDLELGSLMDIALWSDLTEADAL